MTFGKDDTVTGPTKPQTNASPKEAVWLITGASARGASKVRAKRPNQDALGWHYVPELAPATAIIAVADGHGSARYLRSHQGAKLAVQMALRELPRFLDENRQHDLATLKRNAEEQLPRTLVRSWQDAVAGQLERDPLSPEEDARLAQLFSPEDYAQLPSRPQRIFGTTLLCAILTLEHALFLQLGDGDIVTVDAQGVPARPPLRHDARLFANQTTSLAGVQAWHDMRVYFQPFLQGPPALTLLATDGYANSFVDDAGFLSAAADFHTLIAEGRSAYLRRHLAGWLAETSELGSGDDTTVCLTAHNNSRV
jgi:hypothetical protein